MGIEGQQLEFGFEKDKQSEPTPHEIIQELRNKAETGISTSSFDKAQEVYDLVQFSQNEVQKWEGLLALQGARVELTTRGGDQALQISGLPNIDTMAKNLQEYYGGDTVVTTWGSALSWSRHIIINLSKLYDRYFQKSTR